MLIQPDCIPCILKMSLSLLRKLDLDPTRFDRLYSQILDIPALRGQNRRITSPEVIETIMHLMTSTTGDPDPFSSEKAKMNRLAETLFPVLKEQVNAAPDPLEPAVKIAILGNAIDFMIEGKVSDMEALIKTKLETPLPGTDYARFKKKMETSKVLIYFCDNAGEIVFDRLLLKVLKKRYPGLEIFAVVRSIPTLNDATLKEAEAAGLNEMVTVLENGIDGPLPGTILHRCSNRVKALVAEADLIISKGGGNFDTLEEELGDLKTDITFMLLSKCAPYTVYFEAGLYQPLLYNVYDTDDNAIDCNRMKRRLNGNQA